MKRKETEFKIGNIKDTRKTGVKVQPSNDGPDFDLGLSTAGIEAVKHTFRSNLGLKPGDKNEVTITNDYNVRANYVRLYVAPDEEASNHDIVIVEPQKGAYPKEHLKVGDKDYTYMGSTTVIDGIVGKGGVTVRVESQRTEWHPTYVKQPASILGAEHDALLRSVIGGSDQRPSSRSQYISDSPLYAPDRLRDIGSRPPSGSRRKFEE